MSRMEKDWENQFDKIWKLWVKKAPYFADAKIGWVIVEHMKKEEISFIHNNPLEVFIGFLHRNDTSLKLDFTFEEKEVDKTFLTLIKHISNFEIAVRFYLINWEVHIKLVEVFYFVGSDQEKALALLNGMPEEFRRSIEIQEAFMPEILSDRVKIINYKRQSCDYMRRTYNGEIEEIKKYVLSNTHGKLQELKQELMTQTDLA